MERKHSRMGIASFSTSVFTGVSLFILVVIAGVLETTTPGGLASDPVKAGVIGLFMIFLMFVDIVAFGLGVAGLFQKNRQKVFATLGTIFSSLTVTGMISLIVIGNSVA